MIVYVAIITIKTLYRYFFRTSLVFLAITSHGPYNSLEKNMPSNFYLKYFTPIILPFPIFIARNTFFQLWYPTFPSRVRRVLLCIQNLLFPTRFCYIVSYGQDNMFPTWNQFKAPFKTWMIFSLEGTSDCGWGQLLQDSCLWLVGHVFWVQRRGG